MICYVLLLRTYTSAVLLVRSFLTEFFSLSLSLSHTLCPYRIFYRKYILCAPDDSHDDACNNARACAMCVYIFFFFFYTYIVAVVIHEHRLSISAASSIDCSPLCATMECVNPISSIVWTRARDTQ